MNHQWNVLTEDMEDMENTSNMDNQSTENNKSCEKTNIVVIGQSSVGKRSLIQAVTRRGTVPYRLLKDIYCGGGNTVTIGIDVYETEIANFIVADNVIRSGQRMEEYAGDILNTVGAYLKLSSAGTAACNIWFCIDGSCENISNEDAALIKNCSREVLLVVTKCELMRKEQTESTMNELLALIDRDRIVMVSAENKTGLPQLIKKAQTMAGKAVTGDALNTLQERWDAYYADMRESWNENVSDEADGYINWAAGRAATIALLPLPMADVAPLMLNEVYMIYKLAGVYGVAVDNTVITMLLGCAGGSILGKVGASLLPFLKVPIAAGITYGVGKAAKAYFESDMTMNISQLKEIFLNGEREAKGREWGM